MGSFAEDEPMILELECWSDELSPAQEAAYKKLEDEFETVRKKLSEVVGRDGCAALFEGTYFKLFQVDGDVEQLPSAARILRPSPSVSKREGGAPKRKPIIIDDDDDDDLPLKRPARNAIKPKKEKEKATRTVTPPPLQSPPKIEPKETGRKTKSPKATLPVKEEKEKPQEPLFRPSEVTAVGGLTVGVKKKDSPPVSGPDSKEVTFNRIQGKTFPSLVVIARPSLKVVTFAASNRPELDSKVKVVLILSPAKFTEWLIQQGLLKSDQKHLRCHKKNDLKLGVYSDGSKFPYSGGYVWISECRPVSFISVYNGSLFEGAPHPPSCILKLIYHWSCQTSIQNVIQWVKIDNNYIKTVYTWLRAICTIVIQQHLKPMGGPGKYIEVGVISLGTTTQDGQQRQVKVEVLGVFNQADETIRLRAIEPLNESERSYKKRFAKILEPLNEWIVKDSIVTIDLTVDKSVLLGMGFKNVLQVSASEKNAKHTNANVMDYLRRIVPRMFQNTLSLLSREMIQQFLDELVWREQYGTSPLQTFTNITKHIAEQTRLDVKESLINRLNKVAANPFNDWRNFVYLEAASSSTTIKTQSNKTEPPKRGRPSNLTPKESSVKQNPPVKKEKEPASSKYRTYPGARRKQVMKVLKDESENVRTKSPINQDVEKSSESVLFEETFYGKLQGLSEKDQKFPIENLLNAECPDCSKPFDSNVNFQKHIFNHIIADSNSDAQQCIYCLEKFTNAEKMAKHCDFLHPLTSKNAMSPTFNCIICENRFNSILMLSTHMQKVHGAKEMPYRCGICDYRSSARRNVIDHFYKAHDNVGVVQCNFCLLVFQISAKSIAIEQNINIFIDHLQTHFVKALNKKCSKCALTFHNKGSLKVHLLYDHQSFVGKRGVKPLIENSVCISMPKLKNISPKELLSYKIIKDFTQVTQHLAPGKMCLECDAAFEEENHLIGYLKCQKCRYQTCCARAMLDHTSSCQSGVNPESNVHIKLDTEMHCVCGFSSCDGNSLARHLAVCDHKSAYPSVEVAQENTVKRNMLDMLGLIRRSGDSEENNGGQSKDSNGGQKKYENGDGQSKDDCGEGQSQKSDDKTKD